MNYTAPEADIYNADALAELAGPVETQYIANPSIQGDPCREFEICFEYDESWCEGEILVYREGNSFPDKFIADNGTICVPLFRSGSPEGFTESIWIECDGERSNVLEVEIPACDPT